MTPSCAKGTFKQKVVSLYEKLQSEGGGNDWFGEGLRTNVETRHVEKRNSHLGKVLETGFAPETPRSKAGSAIRMGPKTGHRILNQELPTLA